MSDQIGTPPKHTHFVADVETGGPTSGLYSMISFGAVVVTSRLGSTYYSQVRPVSDLWMPDYLAVNGYTREETLTFPLPEIVMPQFVEWVERETLPYTTPKLWSDNPGFDWGFVNHCLWGFTGRNPFGHSSRSISDVFFGLTRGTSRSFDHLRQTPHSHHPLDDARGNAEALLAMVHKYGLHLD